MNDKSPPEVRQPVDDKARRLAKELVRTARYAALGTLDAQTGAPSVSRIALATFMNGDPGFFISALAAHQRNLVADRRCSLLVGEPGKGDPLAHPRMTLIGEAEALQAGGAVREAFRGRYRSRHPKSKLYEDLPDFSYWRFRPRRVSLNAGFGKAFELEAEDLAVTVAVDDAWQAIEPGVVGHMNADHADAVDVYANAAGGDGAGWHLACIDPEGLDLVKGDNVRRLWFEAPLLSVGDIRPRLVALSRRSPS